MRRIPKNDRSIKEVLDGFLEENQKAQEGINQERLRKFWQERYGKVINSYTERINYNRGVLRIKINSAALKQELLMSKSQIEKDLEKSLPDVQIKNILIQ